MNKPIHKSAPHSGDAETREPHTKETTFERLLRIGLGEGLYALLGRVVLAIGLLTAFWLLANFYQQNSTAATSATAPVVTLVPSPTPAVENASEPVAQTVNVGIPRLANPHTIIPTRPRLEVVKYTVQPGDTVFGIAEKFGLKPQTVLWANYYILKDDPHNLRPGQELNILPVDGTYYEWQAGDGLNGVARFFGVTPEDIINYPGNHLDPDTIGDYSNPNIEPGTWLIVPGGHREFVSWSAPIGVTRSDPAVARILGPGSCGPVQGGAVGFGSFIWPSNKHYLSGYDYSPETNHRGIDIAGNEGEALYAVDAGVIVYAGWNNWGYGYMVMIDHGNGWQSLYAHMSAINVVCGQSVGQGEVIGAIGSTGNSSGPHLHFELMHSQYGKVNPWDFLPPP